MDHLHARNQRIIDAVVERAEALCPGVLDLVAVTGSFRDGRFHEHSDLDLVLVINDPSGWAVADCFILDGVGFDLYCHSWDRLAQLTTLPHPFVGALLDAEVVHVGDPAALERYLGLRSRLQAVLSAPLQEGALARARGHLTRAHEALGRLVTATDMTRLRTMQVRVLEQATFCWYALNRTTADHGVQAVPDDVAGFALLPEAGVALRRALVVARAPDQVREAAVALVTATEQVVERLELQGRPAPTADALRGGYEEAWSNWRTKMHRAAEQGDAHLALVTAAAYQEFLDSGRRQLDLPVVDVLGDFDPAELSGSAEAFDRAMATHQEQYASVGLPVRRFARLDDWLADYLGTA